MACIDMFLLVFSKRETGQLARKDVRRTSKCMEAHGSKTSECSRPLIAPQHILDRTVRVPGSRDHEKPRSPDLRHGGGLHGGNVAFLMFEATLFEGTFFG